MPTHTLVKGSRRKVSWRVSTLVPKRKNAEAARSVCVGLRLLVQRIQKELLNYYCCVSTPVALLLSWITETLVMTHESLEVMPLSITEGEPRRPSILQYDFVQKRAVSAMSYRDSRLQTRAHPWAMPSCSFRPAQVQVSAFLASWWWYMLMFYLV